MGPNKLSSLSEKLLLLTQRTLSENMILYFAFRF